MADPYFQTPLSGGLNWATPGAGHVPEYQVSAIPYVTSSVASEIGTTPLRVAFPRVTRFIQVTNIGQHDIRLGFTANGVNAAETANYTVIHAPSGSTQRLELRCTEIWFRSNGPSHPTGFSVVAGLTTIPNKNFPEMTGSSGGIYGGIG